MGRMSMTKQERQAEDKREYVKEETQKLASMAKARTGRPGECEPYPDLGDTYWKRRQALNSFNT
jgi:hypothetical protein